MNFCFLQQSPFFDGEKAYQYLLKQCDFGTRFPGSQEHINLKNYFVDFLSGKGDTLVINEHTINHPYESKKISIYITPLLSLDL